MQPRWLEVSSNERSFRGRGGEPPSLKRDFDPIAEGARYDLEPSVALEIWAYVRREATDGGGRCDESAAVQRFHQVAARVAANGGRLRPDPGKVTRVDVEVNGYEPYEPYANIAPGKVTRVEAEARRRGRHRGRGERLPGMHEVDQVMGRLREQAPDTSDVDHLAAAIAADLVPTSPPVELPFRSHLEQTFGTSFSGVRAHVGEAAALAPHGARGAAWDETIVFADTEPTLDVVAHELAHVEQLRRASGATGARGTWSVEWDPAELEADAVAQAMARGATSARVSARPSAAISFDRSTGGGGAPTLVNATAYLHSNAASLRAAIVRHLSGVDWPAPDPRLAWSQLDAFRRTLARLVSQHLADFDAPDNLKRICFPSNPLALVDMLRPVGAPAPGTPATPTNAQPHVGGPVGSAAWRPSIGLAIAQQLEAAVVASLRRLGPSWVQVADQGVDEHAALDDTLSPVRYESLIASHPMDRIVGRAITERAVFDLQDDPRRPSAEGGGDARGRRSVRLEWQGARAPQLWNWVKAIEPADATVEEVAASLFARSESKYGERTSFLAYGLTAAPPLFAVPPAWARGFAEATRYAPWLSWSSAAGDAGADERVLAVASGPATAEIALHQSSDEVLPPVRSAAPRQALAELAAGNRIQLTYLRGALEPWGLADTLSATWGFLESKLVEVLATPDANLATWARLFNGQRENLARVGGAVREITRRAADLGVKNPAAPEGAAFHEVLAAYARAAGVSHLVDTSRALIDQAAQKQGSLALRAVQASSHGLGFALDGLRDATAGDDSWRSDLLRAGDELGERSTALQSRLIAGQSVDPSELDDLTLQSDRLALRARVRGAQHQLDVLRQAAHDARDGHAAEFAAAFSDGFSSLEGATESLQLSLTLALDLLDDDVAGGLVDTAHDSPEERSSKRRSNQRAALARAQAAFEAIARNDRIGRMLREGADLVQWQGFRTACVKMAALIGFSIAASLAGSAIARSLGGWLGRAGGATTVTELSASAKFMSTSANVLTDAAINAAGQSAVMGDGFVDGLLENLAMSAGSMAILGVLEREAAAVARLEHQAMPLLQRMGKAGAVIREIGSLSGHAIMGAALGYVAHRVVTGKSQPTPATIEEWFMQGAAITIGRYVNKSVEAHLDGITRISRLKNVPGSQELLHQAQFLRKIATSVEKNPQAENALELLAQRRDLLEAELRVLDALLKDPDAMKLAGVDAAEVRDSMGDVHQQLRESQGHAVADVTFHLSGLEELVPGAAWRGTREQIEGAIREAQRQGMKVDASRDEATGRWTVKTGDREVEVHERAAAPAQSGQANQKQGGRLVVAGDDAELRAAAEWLEPMAGTLDVVVHGTVDELLVELGGKTQRLNHRQLAKLIRKAGGKYDRVRLASCRTGTHAKGVAQHLANKLGMEVLAPSDTLWLREDGTHAIGPRDTRNTGEWRVFTPGKSELRGKASEESDRAGQLDEASEDVVAVGRPGQDGRPTWQESERRVTEELDGHDFTDQTSFRNRDPVPRGTPDSTRPDNYSPTHRLSVDVKNYDVTTAKGRARLVDNVAKQVKQRAEHLREGTRQGVVLDVRGQAVAAEQLQKLQDRIVERSGGLITSDDIVIISE